MSFKLVETKVDDDKFISCKDFFHPIRNKKGISSPIKYDMCEFILCLLIGLKNNKREDVSHYNLQPSFAQKYIDEYVEIKPLITGLILSKIIKINGVDRNEKEKVKNIMKNYLDTNEPTSFKKEGLDIMTQYYLGGYCILLSEFEGKPPVDVSVFFYKYNKLLQV
tara:strand:- start:2 stop:496 length:495 start_codon:yes stop_codon:yes gene_type:complete